MTMTVCYDEHAQRISGRGRRMHMMGIVHACLPHWAGIVIVQLDIWGEKYED